MERTRVVKKPKTTKTSDKPTEFCLSDFPTRSDSLWKIGAHVSAAGGVENTILNAANIGCVNS